MYVNIVCPLFHAPFHAATISSSLWVISSHSSSSFPITPHHHSRQTLNQCRCHLGVSQFRNWIPLSNGPHWTLIGCYPVLYCSVLSCPVLLNSVVSCPVLSWARFVVNSFCVRVSLRQQIWEVNQHLNEESCLNVLIAVPSFSSPHFSCSLMFSFAVRYFRCLLSTTFSLCSASFVLKCVITLPSHHLLQIRHWCQTKHWTQTLQKKVLLCS